MEKIGKRELFKDFINNLLHIEMKIFINNAGKFHESEKELFSSITETVNSGNLYKDDDSSVDKRIKNRLKNKIQSTFESLDLEFTERKIKHQLSIEVSFFNVHELKKLLRKLFKTKYNIQSIHTLLILSDELRTFYLRQKEKNEIGEYYALLNENINFIDFNLGVSYFIRQLDLMLHEAKDLKEIDNEVKKIKSFLKSEHIIWGYKFRLYSLLIQHWMNVGEWEEAKNIAQDLEKKMTQGEMYTHENIVKLHSFLARIYNQTYDKNKYEFYISELDKKQAESTIVETDLINEKLLSTSNDESVSKNVLNRIEKIASKIDSDKVSLYLRLARTDLSIKEKDYKRAKSYNDLFFIDIHNKQVREFLDKIYIHRFVILLHLNDFEEIVRLFESKVTQKRILSLERKGKLLIYPYIIYDIAKYSINEQKQEVSYENIHRMIDYYQFNNRFDCYHMLDECIKYTFEYMNLNNKQLLKMNRLRSMIDDTLKKL